MTIKIVNSDCIIGMRELSAQSIDCVVTSPPYNIDKKYNSYDDKKPHDIYLDWLLDVFVEVDRILSPDGSFFLNIGSKPTAPMLPFNILHLASRFWQLQNTFHWIKNISIHDTKNYGHYKPINSDRYVNDCHEYIFHLTKTGNVKLNRTAIGVPYTDKTNIGRYNNKDCRCRGNNWFIPYETVTRSKQHPAAFPVLLPELCFKIANAKNTCDPFMGSGSSARAAHKLGINFIGFEIDAHYCDLTLKNYFM